MNVAYIIGYGGYTVPAGYMIHSSYCADRINMYTIILSLGCHTLAIEGCGARD